MTRIFWMPSPASSSTAYSDHPLINGTMIVDDAEIEIPSLWKILADIRKKEREEEENTNVI
jgi:hypothetical protein